VGNLGIELTGQFKDRVDHNETPGDYGVPLSKKTQYKYCYK